MESAVPATVKNKLALKGLLVIWKHRELQPKIPPSLIAPLLATRSKLSRQEYKRTNALLWKANY